MLKGKVNRHGEPRVSLSLIRQRPVRFAAVLDTGFNGYLKVWGSESLGIIKRLESRGNEKKNGEAATGGIVCVARATP